jgi:hypothetical protein
VLVEEISESRYTPPPFVYGHCTSSPSSISIWLHFQPHYHSSFYGTHLTPSTLIPIMLRFLSLVSLLVALLSVFITNIQGQDTSKCSAVAPCYQGCCSSAGNCGFGDDFCGTGCQGNCNATAECGENAVPGNFDCPINVCCSKFGYCGTTADFCGDGCQKNTAGGGCGAPV